MEKAIKETSKRPEASPKGIGKPLGNLSGSNLIGCYKIKFKKPPIRVVYKLNEETHKMIIIAIGLREDSEVYKEAARRLKK